MDATFGRFYPEWINNDSIELELSNLRNNIIPLQTAIVNNSDSSTKARLKVTNVETDVIINANEYDKEQLKAKLASLSMRVNDIVDEMNALHAVTTN